MVTIYDLLEVSESASKEEIKRAYEKMIIQYQTNPTLSEKENRDNEFILNKLKMAYEILSNDEKRKKYDNDLAKKRAEALIKNVTVNNQSSSNKETVESRSIDNTVYDQKKQIEKESKTEKYDVEFDDSIEEMEEADEVELTEDEQRKLRKAAQMEFKKNLKKAQKAEEEYKQAYEKAYNDYIKKNKYQIGKNKLKKAKNIIIVLLVILVFAVIIWHIPPIRTMLIELYNENVVVKIFVDIVRTLINSILGIFKK